jgi:hypothetical protein
MLVALEPFVGCVHIKIIWDVDVVGVNYSMAITLADCSIKMDATHGE